MSRPPGYARLDEDDVRVRPGRGSQPRTRRRPAHASAVQGFVTSVDRGRYGCITDGRLIVAMKARELGRGSVVVGDRVALAEGPSTFTGLAHTRRHETDRLAALAKEINALGGDVTELPDGLQVRPRPLRAHAAGGLFGTYDDHRMVMAAAVLGLAVPGLRVANAQTVAKTFPGFTDVWADMLAGGRDPGSAW